MAQAVSSDCFAVAEGKWDETAGRAGRQRMWQESLVGTRVAATKHRQGKVPV